MYEDQNDKQVQSIFTFLISADDDEDAIELLKELHLVEKYAAYDLFPCFVVRLRFGYLLTIRVAINKGDIVS